MKTLNCNPDLYHPSAVRLTMHVTEITHAIDCLELLSVIISKKEYKSFYAMFNTEATIRYMCGENVVPLFLDLPEGARDEILIIGMYFVQHTQLVDLEISELLNNRLAILLKTHKRAIGINHPDVENSLGFWRNVLPIRGNA